MSRRGQRKTGVLLALLAVGMFGFGFALVPLYEVFCEVTGLRLGDGGTGRIAAADLKLPGEVAERWVTVHFDASVERGLPWRFEPQAKFMKVRVGEPTETHYVAANRAHGPIVGRAVPSVAPTQATLYFGKTECFCFTEQLLDAGEQRDMPVRFVIDPGLPEDVKVMTLSYRFYHNEEATARVAAAGDNGA